MAKQVKIPIQNYFEFQKYIYYKKCMLQRGTNIMANQVKTPIKNYFENFLYENHSS
jgi:hypothetical protein